MKFLLSTFVLACHLPALSLAFTNSALVLGSTPMPSSARASTTVDEDLETSRHILANLASKEATQTKLTPEQVQEYNTAIEGLPPPPDFLDVDGGWDLLATISPEAEVGDNVDFFDSKAWKKYISGSGPSPFQSLITGRSTGHSLNG
jgi:hypothetical protein